MREPAPPQCPNASSPSRPAPQRQALGGTAGRATASAVCIPRSAISTSNSSRTSTPGRRSNQRHHHRPAQGPTPLFCLVTAGVEAACLSIMGGVAAGGRPIDRGVDSVSGWLRLNISRCPALNISRWPRLKHVVAVMMVTMYRFLSDCGARKADRQSDRSDEAFDHGSMFSIERRQPIAASSRRGMPSGEHRRWRGGRKSAEVNRQRLTSALPAILNELSRNLDCTVVSRR